MDAALVKRRIYLSEPDMGGNELRYITEAFESNWIAPAGPHIKAFEDSFSATVGSKYAVAVNSGTAAIHLALRLLGIGLGDEVLCSTFTFIASANPILYLGARPVFIDVSNDTWHVDIELLEEFLKERAVKKRLPKAFILPHIYGLCADISEVCRVCEFYGVPVIEDAAESLGCRYGDKSPGTFGVMGAFSFNGNKIITTSGGGMLVTDDQKLSERARYLVSQAREQGPSFVHGDVGYNYRLSNVLAAIGLGQLEILDKRVQRKREIFLNYKRGLEGLEGLSFMPEPDYCVGTHWLSCVIINASQTRLTPSDVAGYLQDENIESRFFWTPMHLQKYFLEYEKVGGAVAEALSLEGLCLPCSTKLTEDEQSYIISKIREVWN